MKTIITIFKYALFGAFFAWIIVAPFKANALTLGESQGYINGFCGAYASVVGQYEMFSNAVPNPKLPCPGDGCPGITRYTGNPITGQTFQGIVAPNTLITDVYANGALAPNRMFSRPFVTWYSGTYYATAMVMNGYFPPDGMGVPAFLTSQDGKNWTYFGKFGGEVAEYLVHHKVFASGMALIVSDTSPRFRFYTDGFGVKVAQIFSDDGRHWEFVRDVFGNIEELAPPEWQRGAIFHSIALHNGTYYLAASDGWPVQAWQFAHSKDGLNFIHDKIIYTDQKNVSLFNDSVTGKLMALPTTGGSGSCFYKKLKEVIINDTSQPPRKKKRRIRSFQDRLI